MLYNFMKFKYLCSVILQKTMMGVLKPSGMIQHGLGVKSSDCIITSFFSHQSLKIIAHLNTSRVCYV